MLDKYESLEERLWRLGEWELWSPLTSLIRSEHIAYLQRLVKHICIHPFNTEPLHAKEMAELDNRLKSYVEFLFAAVEDFHLLPLTKEKPDGSHFFPDDAGGNTKDIAENTAEVSEAKYAEEIYEWLPKTLEGYIRNFVAQDEIVMERGGVYPAFVETRKLLAKQIVAGWKIADNDQVADDLFKKLVEWHCEAPVSEYKKLITQCFRENDQGASLPRYEAALQILGAKRLERKNHWASWSDDGDINVFYTAVAVGWIKRLGKDQDVGHHVAELATLNNLIDKNGSPQLWEAIMKFAKPAVLREQKIRSFIKVLDSAFVFGSSYLKCEIGDINYSSEKDDLATHIFVGLSGGGSNMKDAARKIEEILNPYLVSNSDRYVPIVLVLRKNNQDKTCFRQWNVDI